MLPSGLPRWRTVLSDGHCESFAATTTVLFDLAISPSYSAVATKLSQARIANPKDFALIDGLRDAQLDLGRSFALAMGGQWERQFRHFLRSSASVLHKSPRLGKDRIEKASWQELDKTFTQIREFSLKEFSSYKMLAMLYNITSACRHGNGPAMDLLCTDHPELFEHEPANNWFNYLTLGGERKASIWRLDISLELLGKFHDAIVEFWTDIGRVRQLSKSKDDN